jgi:hypothetical protein
MRTSTLAVTCFLSVATGGDAWSQTYQGGLRGAVRDANGVLPGAEVALVNEETNAVRSTLVNGAGEYAFANVLPGTYTVRASLTGFKTFDASAIRIGTQDYVVLGGWAFSVVGMYQSGFPVVGGQANNNSLGSAAFGSGQRPNVVPGVAPSIVSGRPEDNYDRACACIRWLNPAAWSSAAPFTFGDAPRTDTGVRTPSQRNWDLAFQKTHPVGGKRLTVRAELINAFNNPALVVRAPASAGWTSARSPRLAASPGRCN